MDMNEQNLNENGDYQHGYTRGMEGIDREVYENYLSSNVTHDWIQDRLNEKKQELSETRSRNQQALAEHKVAE
jgi:hypothetical protein